MSNTYERLYREQQQRIAELEAALERAREQMIDQAERAERAEATLREVVKGYAEAIDDVADWAAYASMYFQRKHGLESTIAEHRAILAKYQKEVNRG